MKDIHEKKDQEYRNKELVNEQKKATNGEPEEYNIDP